MQLSIIIPAYNEQRLLPGCLASVRTACAAVGCDAELIVVDNNSTDATASVAESAGARVIFEPVNQIGRARNAGAAAAGGDWLLFLDADSTLEPALLAELLALTETGRVVAAGSTMRMPEAPWWGRAIVSAWNLLSQLCRWAAGSLLLCRADAFRELGGFDEQLYVAEEIDLCRRLKRWGRKRGLRLVILSRRPLQTSGRKFCLYTPSEILAQMLRLALRPLGALKDRAALSLWYGGRR